MSTLSRRHNLFAAVCLRGSVISVSELNISLFQFQFLSVCHVAGNRSIVTCYPQTNHISVVCLD